MSDTRQGDNRAADNRQAAIDKQLKDGQQKVEQRSTQALDASEVKPTPTQEECDRAKLGEHVVEHEADGSPEQPAQPPEPPPPEGETLGTRRRQVGPQGGGGAGDYQTRATQRPADGTTGGRGPSGPAEKKD